MSQTFATFFARLRARLVPLMDLSAWLLLILAVPLMLVTAPSMLASLVQWSVFGIALAGVAVALSRLIFPMIQLGEWLDMVKDGVNAGNGDNVMPAAVVVASTMLTFVGLFLGLVLWAKT